MVFRAVLLCERLDGALTIRKGSKQIQITNVNDDSKLDRVLLIMPISVTEM